MGAKRADIVFSVVLILLAAWIYSYTARTLPAEAQMYTLGPDVFPKLLALLLAFLSLTLVVTAWVKGIRHDARDQAGVEGDRPEPRAGESRSLATVVGSALLPVLLSPVSLTVIAMAIYVVIMPGLGYIPSTVLLLAFLIWVFGGRRTRQALLPAVIVTAGLYLLFGVVLNVLLPPGIFFR